MACEISSGCKNDIYGRFKYCVLHCSHEDIESKDMDDYLKKFSEIFMKYLYESILHNKFYLVGKDKNVTSIYGIDDFKYKNIIDNKLLIEKLKTMDIIIKNIVFPESSKLENYILNASTIIKYLGKVNFENCKFGHLIFNGIKNYYHKYCTFSKDIEIFPFPQVKNKDNEESIEYRYVDCIFEGDVTLTRSIFTDEIYCNMFYDCFFNENVIVNNLKFKKTLLKFPDILQVIENKKLVDIGFDGKKEFERIKYCYKIKNLSVINCSFESEFKLNGISKEYYQRVKNAGYEIENNIFNIDDLSLIDNKFKSKVEIKHRIVKDFKFENSNVDGIFDAYKSCFINARFYKVIFEEFAAFEYVVFGDDCIDNRADFIYVTFKDFSNFRDTNFKSGLNFSRANLKQEPNFLNATVNVNYTDRETLRIIKNSFEKVNNKIESNRFFIHEMSSYREEIKGVVHSKIVYVKIIEYNKKIKSYIDKKIDRIVDCNNSIFVVLFISVITSTLIIFKTIFLLLRIPIIIFKYIGGNFNFKYLVLNINHFISGFGESYIRPIMIFLMSIGIYTYIEIIHKSIFKENSFLKDFMTQGWFVSLSEFLNACAANIPLFSKALEKKSGIEFISLLFFIWFGILTWQIIIAVKRNTQH